MRLRGTAAGGGGDCRECEVWVVASTVDRLADRRQMVYESGIAAFRTALDCPGTR